MTAPETAPMSPKELDATLDELGWSAIYFAEELLGASRKAHARWRSGRAEIPPRIAEWLRLRLALHRAHPPPEVWRPPLVEADAAELATPRR